MSTYTYTVPAIGPQPCEILVCGQRPGPEEYDYGEPFIGRAGEELWARVRQYIGLEKRQVRVTNLVPTFDPDLKPPTPAEMRQWELWRKLELQRTRPKYIIAVGYDAARYFLPQFAEVDGSFFHGLAFPYVYGDVYERTCTVIPIVHSSAALRQPERYQLQLVQDCQAVKRVLDGAQGLHAVKPFSPYPIGLAEFGRDGLAIACDTEGTIASPEAVTLSHNGKYAHLSEVFEHPPSKFLISALHNAGRVICHAATADMPVLEALGVDLDRCVFDDTMIKAYLLQLPQALKTLAYRLRKLEMSSYQDLVRPIDEALTRTCLREWLEKARAYLDRQQGLEKDRRAFETRRLRISRAFGPEKARQVRQSVNAARAARHASLRRVAIGESRVPRRALTSVAGILDTPADASTRERWQDSTFAAYIPLPPAPTWKDAPIEKRQPYALADAGATKYIDDDLTPELRRQGLMVTYGIDRAVLPFLARNEKIGLACDGDRMQELAREFQQRFTELCTELHDLVGWDVNPNAPPDVAEALFEDLGLPHTRPTKSGKHYTTADKYLKAMRKEHHAIEVVIDARKYNKLRGTYADKVPGLLKLGRYHPDWRYTRTATGRLAEPLIVLIPKHTREGLEIRACFHATKGHRLVLVDLSQIEMRVMAHLSGDTVLLDAFKNGIDPHSQTAYHVFGAPKRKEEQDETRHRLPSKIYNFSIINGSTEYGLLDQLNEQHCLQPSGEPWDLDSVQYALKTWFEVHKGVDQYWDDQVDHGREHGYVRMMHGRKRYVPGLHSSDERIVKEAERQCLAPIQGTADDISKIWNAKIWREIIQPRLKRGWYCEPWVRVHDETALEVDEHGAADIADLMIACLPQLLRVPVTAEYVIEERWGQHKLDQLIEKERAA